ELFPRAKLIVHRREILTARNPHPLQWPWYVPGAYAHVGDDRLLVFDGDLWLGRGLALVHTPGHTQGHMSLAVVTPKGRFVSSETGVAADSWAPAASTLAGVQRNAAWSQHQVVLNGNTRDGSAEQYTSMLLERALAGRSPVRPEFYNVLPSSE